MKAKLDSRTALTTLLILTSAFAGAVSAQKTNPGFQRLKSFEQHLEMRESSPFGNLKWQFLGPKNISGRVTDVDVQTPRDESYTIYLGTASGGVWKTVNEGVTWEPIFEQAASTSIGNIEIAPSNPDVIWVGTGEANIFRSSMAGCGVYKSSDGGSTWKHMGLENTHTIPRIVIHPENENIVYVASSGHEWTNNPERGVYKTTDGGKTWEKVLYINEMTGAIDLVMDLHDPETLYAATWQRIRKRWNDPRNGPDYDGSGIYKTTDGGRSWTPVNNGLPQAKHRGRIGIDLCRSKPNVIYAFVDNYDLAANQPEENAKDSYGRPLRKIIKGAEIYRSDDSGITWRKMSPSNEYMQKVSSTYGWVFGQMRVDPNDEDTIYVMGLELNVSNDSGKSFRPLRGMHLDHHGLWIDPNNSNFLADANDGGLVLSYDAGKNWRKFTHLVPVVQFYNIGYDMEKPFHIYGSIQDHGSFRSSVDLSKGRDKIPAKDWERAPGGEGSTHRVDPNNSNIVYSAGFYGRITRTDLSTRKTKRIVPQAEKGQPPYRGQWIAPFILSPHDSNVVYHGMNRLFRSENRGDQFKAISPDLTHNNLNRIGDISYQTISSISESPLQAGLIYCGTDDGRIHVTRNTGKNWQEITSGLAEDRWISRVVASQHELGTAYLTQNGKRNDDFQAYVWKSKDFGATWKSINANLPGGPVNVIREDPLHPKVLYAGTDTGVYISVDDGKKWQTIGKNLPATYVHDLIIHPRDMIMVIATHGRGMFALDVKPIHKSLNR